MSEGLKTILLMEIQTNKIKYKKLIGKAIPSDNPIESLVNQYTYMLNMDDYPDDDVIQLEVKQVKRCLRIIIKRAYKRFKKAQRRGR